MLPHFWLGAKGARHAPLCRPAGLAANDTQPFEFSRPKGTLEIVAASGNGRRKQRAPSFHRQVIAFAIEANPVLTHFPLESRQTSRAVDANEK
jgi:hypothetical protein